MKYLLALFVLLVVVACSGANTEQVESSGNTAGSSVEDLNLEEIDKELEEIESELNLDEELENLEVSLE